MTDTEVHIEHDSGEHQENLAEAIADAQLEVAHELQQEQVVEQAQETAESAIEIAQDSAPIGHEHSDYALNEHSHPEMDHSERFALLESRIENIEHGLAEEVEEPVEEIEPTETAPVKPQTKPRRHSFGRR